MLTQSDYYNIRFWVADFSAWMYMFYHQLCTKSITKWMFYYDTVTFVVRWCLFAFLFVQGVGYVLTTYLF